jgi:2-polyprenyl-6-methoxyphenol hydroxylase-like FAD-dependent oxidoreductase
MKIAINGCGIAGPALAWWLRHYGHEPLLIEQSPRMRQGGYAIDFWGLGFDICEKMALIPRLREAGYRVGEVRFVDDDGRREGGFQVEAMARLTKGRFISLRRSDVSAALYEAPGGKVETLFGDSVSAFEDRGDRVHIEFAHAAPREVDLLIGADGLHSGVRALAFGPEERFEKFLGYYVAAFDLSGYRPRDELVYVSHAEPGRQISRFSMRDDRTLILMVFRKELMDGPEPQDDAARKAALRRIFANSGWETAAILDAMEDVSGIYFDRVSQIHMPDWSKGRVGLIGDAAAAVSLLAGEGTGLAITEAYVLAGELHRAGGDHAAAFARYQHLLKPFLAGKQKSAETFASSFAPRTRLGIAFRNLVMRLMGVPLVADWFIGRSLRDDLDLPDYGSL